MLTDKIAMICGKTSFERYLFGALIALELLMSFTFLGYIHIPPISITIAYIPVMIAACLLGPGRAVIIGVLFGLGSLYKASASYVLAADKVFSPFQSGRPLESIILSVGTRAVFALVTGLLFAAAARAASDAHTEPAKRKRLFCMLTALLAAISPKIHAFMVLGTMGIFFPEFGYSWKTAFAVSFNDVMLALLCVIAVEAAWLVYDSATVRDFAFCVDMAAESPYIKRRMNWFFLTFEIFIVILSIFATEYFSGRTLYLLKKYEVRVSGRMSNDIHMLHIQFLIAMLALSLISLLLVICIYRYMSYREYRGDLDALTGVMGRRMFMYHCERIHSGNDEVASDRGWFLFVDVDYFKSINDTFGHAVGDMVLREIASYLQKIFGAKGAVGRVGGDEFAVMIEKPMVKSELETLLDRFLAGISDVISDSKIKEDRSVSCSIGVCRFTYPQEMKVLMSRTDELLYQAKSIGRACYVIETETETTAGGPRLNVAVD